MFFEPINVQRRFLEHGKVGKIQNKVVTHALELVTISIRFGYFDVKKQDQNPSKKKNLNGTLDQFSRVMNMG